MLVSQSQFAKTKGVSRAYINKLVKQGKLPNHGGKLDPDEANKALEASRERPVRIDKPETLKPESRPEPRQSEVPNFGPNLVQAKTVYETYRAKREKLEYERMCGRLVDVQDIQKTVVRAYGVVRTRLLAMPAKLTPVLIGRVNQAEIKEILETEILTALTELVESAGKVGDGE